MGAPEINYRALGKRGGLTNAATHDMRAVAAHARKSAPSSLDYWRKKITDQFGELDPADRDARARAAQSLHFSKLAARSHRRKKANR